MADTSRPAPAPSEALADARVRGAEYVRTELITQNLLLPAAAEAAGLTVEELRAQTSAGEFYAFNTAPDALRFPPWQFKAPLTARKLLIGAFTGHSTWALHLFTSRPNMYLGELSPREYVLHGDFEMDALKRAVDYRLCGQQGAA